MKVFLSALNNIAVDYMLLKGVKWKWNLLSYYQLYKGSKGIDSNSRSMELFYKVLNNSEEVLIDSGAHSFQKGKKVDWDDYTRSYCEFIKAVDCPKIIGYFEMDVDNIIGYQKVLQLRNEIEIVTDKCIPVWHNNRGISDFKEMCSRYSGRIVSITGFRGAEFNDEQYPMFVKEAWKNNCRIHCLGMTRNDVLRKVPFDYTDSSSWLQMLVYGNVYNPQTGKYQRISRSSSKKFRNESYALNYLYGMEVQKFYFDYWRRYNGHYENRWT